MVIFTKILFLGMDHNVSFIVLRAQQETIHKKFQMHSSSKVNIPHYDT